MQAVMALRAAVERVRFDAGGRFAAATMIMFGRAFFARALWRMGVGAVRLDERGWVVALLFELGDTSQGRRKLL